MACRSPALFQYEIHIEYVFNYIDILMKQIILFESTRQRAGLSGGLVCRFDRLDGRRNDIVRNGCSRRPIANE